MIIFNILFFLFFIICYILTKKCDPDFIGFVHPDRRYLKVFFPLCSFVLHKFNILSIKNINNKRTDDILCSIYINEDHLVIKKKYWCERISLAILIILLFNGISLFSELYNGSYHILLDNKFILRPEYGQGMKEVALTVGINNEDVDIETEIDLSIEEQRYNPAELIIKLEEAREYILSDILGNNPSLDHVTQPLRFINNIPGTSIQVKWIPEDISLIDFNGTVYHDDIPNGGTLTCITAVIQYYDTTAEFPIFLRIMPMELSAEDKLINQLKLEITDEMNNSLTKPEILLPDEIIASDSNEKVQIQYVEPETKSGMLILIIGILIGIGSFYLEGQTLGKKMKAREHELLKDYPELINKVTLLLGAGLTIKGAWEKITKEYVERRIGESSGKRYLYEEMRVTLNELYNGRGEGEAYIAFGRRIKQLPYIKFSSLLEQNRKKGTKGLIELLEYEGYQAFEERKELAKRLGEQAGTKLLGPMMILLVIVLFIVMVPAFLTL